MRTIRIFRRALVPALLWIVLAASGAIAQSPSPSPSPALTAATPKPGPPATYYAAYGLIALAGITVLAVLAAYLYHAPGFRQRGGRGAAG